MTLSCGAALAVWTAWPAPNPAPAPSPSDAQREAVVRAEKCLAWADRKARFAVDGDLAPLDEFFAAAKRRTPQFADVVLGWGSKWRFVADKTPFTEGGRHAAFMREAFEEHLFKPDELARLIEQVARSYATHLTAVENRMLVKIREDLDDLPHAAKPGVSDPAALSAAYEAAMERAVERVGNDTAGDVATQVMSLVAGEVLTQVAVRLGVSAGVLGAGAASSWATFGTGLVVGLVVDQLICWLWQRWADPRGNLAAELNDRLDELRSLIIEGDEQTPGLRASLVDFACRRAEARRRAVLGMLSP